MTTFKSINLVNSVQVNRTARSRLDELLDTQLLRTQEEISGGKKEDKKAGAIFRQDNGDFWNDIKTISAQAATTNNQAIRNQIDQTNVALSDSLMEKRVEGIVRNVVQKQHSQLQRQLEERTKDFQHYVDNQVKRSNLAIDHLKDEVKMQGSITASQSIGPAINQPAAAATGQDKKGYARAAPKPSDTTQSELLDGIKHSLAAQTLQCRPVKGHDMPLPEDLDCEVLEIENLETIIELSGGKPRFVDEEQKVLDMLLPTALSMPMQAFIDVEDLDDHAAFVEKCKPPETAAQKERKTHTERVMQIKAQEQYERGFGDYEAWDAEQREKSIRCLLKVMENQVKQMNVECEDMENQNSRQHNKLEEMKVDLDRQAKQAKLDAYKKNLDQAWQTANFGDRTSKVEFADPDERDAVEMVDIADLITDNQMLIARVDAALEDDGGADSDTQSEMNDLTDTLIEGLYQQAVKSNKKDRDSYVTSTKKVIWTTADNFKFGIRQARPRSKKEKARPATAKESWVGNGQSRLFDYERKQMEDKKAGWELDQLKEAKKIEIEERIKRRQKDEKKRAKREKEREEEQLSERKKKSKSKDKKKKSKSKDKKKKKENHVRAAPDEYNEIFSSPVGFSKDKVRPSPSKSPKKWKDDISKAEQHLRRQKEVRKLDEMLDKEIKDALKHTAMTLQQTVS